MAMETLPVISDEEIQPTLHKGRPDAPMLGTAGMQELMDAHPNLNSRYIALLAETLNRNLQNVLAKDNTEPYEPQGPYQPVTLHMLQEAVFNSGGGDMNTLDYDPTNQRRDIYAQATEAQRGMAAIATDAEAEAGTDGQKIMTPRTVKGVVDDAMERVVQVGDIVTTIRQMPSDQYVPCAGQELDTGEYPETAGLQKTPVVFALSGNLASYATSALLLEDGKGLASVSPPNVNNGQLHYTTDYGESWRAASTANRTNPPRPVYLWANGKAVVQINSYLYFMDDFMSNVEINTNLLAYDDACFLPDGHGVAANASSSVGLYYTANYGASWTRSNVTTRGQCAIAPNGRGFACTLGDNFLHTTTNYGVLWSVRGSAAAQYTNISLLEDGHGLCRVGEVWHSTADYGETWMPCAGLPAIAGSTLYHLLDNGHGTLIGNSGAAMTAYYTSDYGATWTTGFIEPLAANEGTTFVRLGLFGGGLMQTNYRTLYTRDYGRSWIHLSDVSLPPFLLDSGRGILGGQYTCNFKLIAPVASNGYMKVRSL